MFSSLRTRLALLVLIAALPALALSLFGNLEQRRQAAEAAREEALRLVRVAAHGQEESVEAARQLLLTLAQLPEVRGADAGACSALLARIREQNLRYANLGVIDRDGNAFCSALPRSGPLYLGDRDYFRQALRTRDFSAGHFQIGRITGRPSINFGYPLFDDEGQVQAVVFAALDLAWLNVLAAELDLQEGAVLFTVDGQGRILTRYPDGVQWIGKALPQAPIVQTILAQQGEGTAEIEGLDGVRRLYSFTPLSTETGVRAYVAAGTPAEAAYAAANRVLYRNLAGLGLLTVLFVGLAWAFADLFILRRVRALALAAQRLTGDDLSARTGLAHGGGELGRLARTFDEMAASLERRMRRLRALSAIDRAITARYALSQTLDVVLQQVTTELNVDAATILLLDPAAGVLEYAAGRGLRSEALRSSRLKLGQGYTGRVAQERRPLFIRDLSQAGGFVQAPLIRDEGFVSYCGVPLAAEGQVQGVLSVFSRAPLDFEAEWVAFLEALALQAAIAIDNARLLEKTRRQARQLRQVVDTMPEGVWLLDPRHQAILANPLGRRYLRLLAGVDVGDAVGALGGQPLQRFLQAPGGDQSWHELTLPQHGQIFEIASQPLPGEGPQQGWVVVVRDVTEERQRQEYMQTHERLATVGELAAGIAHDFNNIMAVIVLHSQVLARRPDHPRREEYLQTILHQAQQASEVVSQILDFGRSTEMKLARLDLGAFVREEAALLRRVLPSGIDVLVDAGEDGYAVQADATRLRQVLMNLAVNARDAMPAGGQLRIGVSRLALQPGMPPPLPDMEERPYVRLTVSDSGSGIPEAVLSRIFEPFFSTKPRGSGTGLGLAQVYGLVKKHGGAIDVQSKAGRGTTFTIYLPALPSPLREGQALGSAESAG